MNIITGYRGEPHITSGQDRAQNQGTYGTGSYILDVGRKLAAEIVSANEIRIRDGVLSHQGCIANIEKGAYDSLEIANGTQGMSRIDLIVARYTKDAETNVEDIELVVIEGTAAASSPAVPSYNTGDIQAGDSTVDMPLYRVNISGVNIGSVTQVASAVRTQAETDTLLGNTSISGIGGGTLTGAVSALNSNMTPHPLTIVKASSNYTINKGFAFRLGRLVVFSIEMTSSSQISAGQGLFRFDYDTNRSIVPTGDTTGVGTLTWAMGLIYETTQSITTTVQSGGHTYIASGTTIPANTTIRTYGTFVCNPI